MKYYCETCNKNVDDNGPYEMSNGDYCCQDCLENGISMAEALYDQQKESPIPNLIPKIKEYMSKNSLKQYQLAQILDVPDSQLNRWLRGRVSISKVWQGVIKHKLKL